MYTLDYSSYPTIMPSKHVTKFFYVLTSKYEQTFYIQKHKYGSNHVSPHQILFWCDIGI